MSRCFLVFTLGRILMSESKHIPNTVNSIPNIDNTYTTTEFVPQKAIGAKSTQKSNIHNPAEEHLFQNISTINIGPSSPSLPRQYYENPFHVVNELEEKHEVSISGLKRNVLECIAKCNLKGQCPTQKEILEHSKVLKISGESLKKIMQRSCGKGLVLTHPERVGNEYQYVLSNMQDIVKTGNVAKRNSTAKRDKDGKGEREDNALENSLENFFLQILKNKPNPEFHNITLESKLQDNGDYHNLHNWDMPSPKNKAKIFKKMISRKRSFNIMIYPNGTTIINIEASQQPFGWQCRDGWIEFIGICGQILQVIIDVLSYSRPLTSEIYDWQILQMDVGYDIPISTPNGKGNLPSKGSFELARPFNGCIKVKHLDRTYQVYDKQLPHRGSCIRIEERHSFSSSDQSFQKKSQKNMVKVFELKKSFLPVSVEEIIKTVFSIDTHYISAIAATKPPDYQSL